MLFPLGENLYASVKTRRGSVKIHGRHYAVPTSTKGGKVKPTQKGVAMSLKQCERLFRVKRKLFELYHEQASSLAGKVVMNPIRDSSLQTSSTQDLSDRNNAKANPFHNDRADRQSSHTGRNADNTKSNTTRIDTVSSSSSLLLQSPSGQFVP